jgi:hypothetical protein
VVGVYRDSRGDLAAQLIAADSAGTVPATAAGGTALERPAAARMRLPSYCLR